MARTIQEIRQEIQEEFINNPVLQAIYGITGSAPFEDEFSLTSLEAQLIEVFSNSSKTIEDLFDLHIKDVNQVMIEKEPGTEEWYKRRALEFQYGDDLEWSDENLVFKYPEINTDNQIIKLASVTVNQANASLLIKVAKLDNNGLPEALSLIQLTAFKNYMKKVKYAGEIINYVSREPDILRLTLKVFYNPMVLAADGSLLSDDSIFPVSDAVDEYLKLIPFNGLFNITNLIDALQHVEGVENPLFVSAKARFGSSPWETITDYYLPNAGYMKMDDVVPLTVEYIAL